MGVGLVEFYRVEAGAGVQSGEIRLRDDGDAEALRRIHQLGVGLERVDIVGQGHEPRDGERPLEDRDHIAKLVTLRLRKDRVEQNAVALQRSAVQWFAFHHTGQINLLVLAEHAQGHARGKGIIEGACFFDHRVPLRL